MILLGILGWISSFIIFSCVGIVFSVGLGMCNKDDILFQLEGGALIATALTAIGYVLAIVIPIVNAILN